MTVEELAEWLHGDLVNAVPGNPIAIDRVAKIEEATAGSLTFLANPKYERHLAATQASAVLVSRKLDLKKFEERTSLVFIRVDDPYVAFLHVLKRLTPSIEPFSPGIHASAAVAQTAVLGKNCSVGAHAVIADGAVIGENTKIGAGCSVGVNAEIGSDCLLYPNAVVYHQCKIGNRAIIHSGAVIGSDGFGHAPKADGSFEKIPQLGIVAIEDDVEIGANTTIDRATLGETRICKGVKIDNLVQIAHNVVVGENTVIAAQTGISGSAKIGKNCMIAGQVGIVGHIEIADRTIIMAQSGIPNTVAEPGKILFGTPADDVRKTQRAYAALKMLPETIREVTALKFKLAELERKLTDKQK